MPETTYVLPFRYSQSIADNLEIIREYLDDQQPGRNPTTMSDAIRYALSMAAMSIVKEKVTASH